jgi:tetratricopeptide (TPR) repeat protein
MRVSPGRNHSLDWTFRAAVLFLLISLVSCSSSKAKLLKAEQLEQQARWTEALSSYEYLLVQVPARDHHLLSDIHAHIGNCMLKLGRAGESLASLEKALELDSGNKTARLHLLDLYIAAGMPERADPEAQYLLERYPHDIQTVSAVASLYVAENRNSAAEALLLPIFRSDRRQTELAQTLAELYDQDQQTDAAREILREAAAAQPHNPATFLQLARIEEQQGNNAMAEQHYREAVAAKESIEADLRLAQFLERTSKLKDAQEVLKRVDTMRPQAPFAAGDMAFATNHWTDAQHEYERILAAESDSQGPGQSREPAVQSRIVEADLQIAARKPESPEGLDAALHFARSHMAKSRDSLDPVTVLVLESETALVGGDINRAVTLAEDAVAKGHNAPAAHYVLGLARYRQGRVQGAVSEWESAISQDAQYYPARLALASVKLEEKHVDEAEEYITEVVREEPANLDALILYARVLLAQHRYDSARYLALRAAVANSSLAEPHVVLGEIAMARLHRPEALIELENAVLLDPHSARAMDVLTALYRTGVITRPMLRRMEATAVSSPPSPTLLELAGRLYADHGWYGDARRCLERAISLDPSRVSSVQALTSTYIARSRRRGIFNEHELASLADAAPNGSSSSLLTALSAQREGKDGVAAERYEAAIRLGDRSGVAANNLAWIYADNPAKLDRALALAKQASEVNPRDPAVLDTLGFVLLQRREYSQAVEVLAKANELLSKRSAASEPGLAATLQRHLRAASLHSGQPDPVTEASNWVGSSAKQTREHN